jgi:hypothetical protein
MKPLYRRLKAVGYDEKYVRHNFLPSWWQDGDALEPSGYTRALIAIARRLGVGTNDLRDESSKLDLCQGPVLFYRRQGDSTADLTAAASVANSAVRVALHGTEKSGREPTISPSDLRKHILGHQDTPWVDLWSLVHYCWNRGTPVIHTSNLPKTPGSKRMVGMAARHGDRYAIVLSSERKYQTWQLFPLAHECGHIACGHLTNDQIRLDYEQEMTDTEDVEGDANDFATQLLIGPDPIDFSLVHRAKGGIVYPTDLAVFASSYGRKHKIYPGLVATTYGREFEKHCKTPEAKSALWARITSSLRIIDRVDGVQMVHSLMLQKIDWDTISSDNREFLLNITGVRPAK